MKGTSHFIIGSGTALCIVIPAQNFGIIAPLAGTELAAVLLLAGTAALLPDIDHPDLLISRTAPIWLGLGLALLGLSQQNGLCLGLPACKLAGLSDLQSWLFPTFSLPQVLGIALMGLAGVLTIESHVLGHRGFMHSMVCAVLMGMSIGFAYHSIGIAPVYSVGFIAGWSSHLAADALTSMGLPYLWWPISNLSDRWGD